MGKKKKNIFKMYKNYNGQRLSERFTDDETRIHYFEPQRKFYNKMCLTKKATLPVIAKQNVKIQRKYYTSTQFSLNVNVL